MTDAVLKADTQEIVLEEVFPHAPETIWKALTSGDLIARWMMAPAGFAAVEGTHFTFKTAPAGEWDGVIRCQVLQVIPKQRLAYAWTGGHAGNSGYGSPLDTVVTWVLTKVEGGTRIRLVHSGFVLPRNDTAYQNMSNGWKKVVRNLDAVVAEQEGTKSLH
ncbi:SRPBCC family protein [Pararhizobium sp.]|uniref:SRPBCC family protein n=1 Tax=Pararhizobium sp. TaxID=1977563 RepID=UPI003D13F538